MLRRLASRTANAAGAFALSTYANSWLPAEAAPDAKKPKVDGVASSQELASFSLKAASALEPRSYVLLVSGTMNPPHQGHIRLGLSAADALRAEGHTVTAVCFVPVHDNYMHNKVVSSGGSALFYPMERRCDMLRSLVRAEGSAAVELCHVVDHEGDHGAELLEESPGYWAPKLPEGYLRTVPTARLISHFARASPHLQAPGSRLGLVFGVDNLAGMASWNRPGQLLESCDLVLLARAAAEVKFGKDPAELLSALAHLRVSVTLPIKHGEETLFGDALGNFANAGSSESGSALYLLPPLTGEDETLSSTRLRKAVVACLEAFDSAGLNADDAAACLQQSDAATAAHTKFGDAASASGDAAAAAEQAVAQAAACLKQHGYAGAAVQPLCAGAAASSAALAKVGEAGHARGELVVPKT